MISPSQTRAHNPLRFIVLQPGARMSYAVPALLARAGMLERFYTDICADVGLLRRLGSMWPERMRPRPVASGWAWDAGCRGRSLARERADSSRGIRTRWHCAGDTGPQRYAQALGPHRKPDTAPVAGRMRYLNGWTEPDRRLIDLVRSDGFAGANALYTVLINSDLDLLREARARGIRTVHEVMIGPDVGRWVQEEQASFPAEDRAVGGDVAVPAPRSRCARVTDHPAFGRKYELAEIVMRVGVGRRRCGAGSGGSPGPGSTARR